MFSCQLVAVLCHFPVFSQSLNSLDFHNIIMLWCPSLVKNCTYSCTRSPCSFSLSSRTNFHPLSPLSSFFLFQSCLPSAFPSSVLHSLIHFFSLCPLSNFLWFGHHICVHVFLSSPCVAFSVISQGSVIFWRHCGWWVGQKHVQLSSMERRWMMIRGYVWLPHPPKNANKSLITN